jgi:uncharacterized protein
MTDAVLAMLRCPLDPHRASALTKEEGAFVCNCGVRYPIRNGLPVLIGDQADLPDGCRTIAALPCRTKKKDSASPAS